MTLITVEDVRGWVENTKLNIQSLDLSILFQLETEVISRIGTVYDTSGWVNPDTTPPLVRVIITKLYTGWEYDRAYSENQNVSNEYAAMLKDNAESLIKGIVDGTIEIPNVVPISNPGPSYYPNDASSAQQPTFDDPSLGPARFSMGKMF